MRKKEEEEEGGPCSLCSFHGSVEEVFRHGLEIHNLFLCAHCGVPFPLGRELMVHLHREHKIPAQSFSTYPDFLKGGGEEVVLYCVHCSKPFEGEDSADHTCSEQETIPPPPPLKRVTPIPRKGRRRVAEVLSPEDDDQPPPLIDIEGKLMGEGEGRSSSSNNGDNTGAHVEEEDSRSNLDNTNSESSVVISNGERSLVRNGDLKIHNGEDNHNNHNNYHHHVAKPATAPTLKHSSRRSLSLLPPPLTPSPGLDGRPRRAPKKMMDEDFVFDPVGRRRQAGQQGPAAQGQGQGGRRGVSRSVSLPQEKTVPNLKIKLEGLNLKQWVKEEGYKSYHQDEEEDMECDDDQEQEPLVVEKKLDPLLVEEDPSKRLLLLVEELSEKLSQGWAQSDQEEPDDTQYELLLFNPPEENMDEDILTEMLQKTGLNCTYCRQVRLIRIDKRQLAVHLFSKHLWTIKFGVKGESSVEESNLRKTEESDKVIETKTEGEEAVAVAAEEDGEGDTSTTGVGSEPAKTIEETECKENSSSSQSDASSSVPPSIVISGTEGSEKLKVCEPDTPPPSRPPSVNPDETSIPSTSSAVPTADAVASASGTTTAEEEEHTVNPKPEESEPPQPQTSKSAIEDEAPSTNPEEIKEEKHNSSSVDDQSKPTDDPPVITDTIAKTSVEESPLPLVLTPQESSSSSVPVSLNEFRLTILKKVFLSSSPLYSYRNKRALPFGEASCECLLCGYSVDAQRNLFIHWKKIHRGVAMKCAMCQGRFLFAGALYSHLCLGTPNPIIKFDPNLKAQSTGGKHPPSLGEGAQVVDIKDDDGSADTIVLRYQCNICEEVQLPGFFNYVVHLRKTHNRCELCLEELKGQKELEHHMKKHKLNHFCWKCGVTYCAKPNFMTHLFWKHGSESKECSVCLKKKWPHIYHFCVPPTFFSCESCGLYFTKAKSLVVHRRLHTGEKLRKCTVSDCTEQFISKRLLEKHVESVHVNPPQKPAEESRALQPPSSSVPLQQVPTDQTDEQEGPEKMEIDEEEEEEKKEDEDDKEKKEDEEEKKAEKVDSLQHQTEETAAESNSISDLPSVEEDKQDEKVAFSPPSPTPEVVEQEKTAVLPSSPPKPEEEEPELQDEKVQEEQVQVQGPSSPTKETKSPLEDAAPKTENVENTTEPEPSGDTEEVSPTTEKDVLPESENELKEEGRQSSTSPKPPMVAGASDKEGEDEKRFNIEEIQGPDLSEDESDNSDSNSSSSSSDEEDNSMPSVSNILDKSEDLEKNLNESAMDIDDSILAKPEPEVASQETKKVVTLPLDLNSTHLDLLDAETEKLAKDTEDFGGMSPLLAPLDDEFNFNVPDIPTFEENCLPEHIIRENALFSLQNEHDYCLRVAVKRGPSSPLHPFGAMSRSPRKEAHRKKAKMMGKKRRHNSSSSSSGSSSCGSNCSCSGSSSSSSSSSSGDSSSDEEENRKFGISIKPLPLPPGPSGPPVKRGRGRPKGSVNRNKNGIPTAKKRPPGGAGKRIGRIVVPKPPRPLNPDGTPMKRKYRKQKGKFSRKSSSTTYQYEKEKGGGGVANGLPQEVNFPPESDLETEDSGSEETYNQKQLTETVGKVPDFDEIWTMSNEKYLLKYIRGVSSLEELANPPPPPLNPISIKLKPFPSPGDYFSSYMDNSSSYYSVQQGGGHSGGRLKVRNVPIKPLIFKRNVIQTPPPASAPPYMDFTVDPRDAEKNLNPFVRLTPLPNSKLYSAHQKSVFGKNRLNTNGIPSSHSKFSLLQSYPENYPRIKKTKIKFGSGRGRKSLSITLPSPHQYGSPVSNGGVATAVPVADEQLYCFCQCPHDNVSQMIGCDSKDCVYQWFHFECVGVTIPPKGKWYCPDCREKRNALKREKEHQSYLNSTGLYAA